MNWRRAVQRMARLQCGASLVKTKGRDYFRFAGMQEPYVLLESIGVDRELCLLPPTVTLACGASRVSQMKLPSHPKPKAIKHWHRYLGRAVWWQCCKDIKTKSIL